VSAVVERSTAKGRGVDWLIMRPATSPDLPDGLFDVRHRWTFRDLYEAHVALDALDDIREILTPKR
jgi:hypothetical protein